MASVCTVLFLGSWLAGLSGVSGQGSYPKPSISISPSGVIPMGGNVTIWCWHQRLGMRFLLYKAGDGNYLTYTDPAGSEAEFPITSARREHGGSYTCRYSNRSVRVAYSEPSDPVQIIVADPSLPKPSISLNLTSVTASGADVTIRCQGQRRDVTFFLHKAGDLNRPRQMDPAGDGAEFHIPTVGQQHRGNYSCSYQLQSEPFVSSEPSDPLQLVVAEPSYPKSNISLCPSWVVPPGGAVTGRCRCQGTRVLLYKAGDPDEQHAMDPAGDVAEFPIRNVSWVDAGSYSCRYSTRWDPPVWSQPSNLVELVIAGGTDPTQPGSEPFVSSQPSDPGQLVVSGGTAPKQPEAAPNPTRPGSAGPGGSEPPAPPGLTSSIIAGVSAAATGLLLLLVAFVCFRITRARKGAAPRPSSTSPMVALKAPAQEDPTYASIDEGKELQTLEPNPGADGLTYIELAGQVLQAKRGGLAPAPEPTQPSVYAVINVSQGAPQ